MRRKFHRFCSGAILPLVLISYYADSWGIFALAVALACLALLSEGGELLDGPLALAESRWLRWKNPISPPQSGSGVNPFSHETQPAFLREPVSRERVRAARKSPSVAVKEV